MLVFLCLFSLAAASSLPACGENEAWVECFQAGCPNLYCPTDGNRAAMVCDSASCVGGCGCLPNFLRLSVHDDRCVPASECPPNECGENEEWDSCTSQCFTDLCVYKDNKPKCNIEPNSLVCNPRCVCKLGFYRSDNNVCVKGEQCPSVQGWGR